MNVNRIHDHANQGNCMYSTEVSIKTLTPTFLRGYDKEYVEFRSSSLKGLIRWWFRALAGNFISDSNELNKQEAEFFGNTKQRSKITLTVKEITKPVSFDNSIEHFKSLGYLFFSVFTQEDGIKQAYKTGSDFSVKIESFDKNAFNVALVSFWALITLGGIGFRSRRGAGSFSFKRKNEELENEGIKTTWNDVSRRDVLKIKLEKSIEKANIFLGKQLNKKLIKTDSKTTFPVLSKNSSRVGFCFSNIYSNKTLKTFEGKYKYDRNKKPKKKKHIFGLPIKFGNISETIENREAYKDNRRASPLHVGVFNYGNEFITKLVYFRTKKFHHNEYLNQEADWDLLDDFFEKTANIELWS